MREIHDCGNFSFILGPCPLHLHDTIFANCTRKLAPMRGPTSLLITFLKLCLAIFWGGEMKVFDSPDDPALSAAKASSLSAAEAEGDILDPKTVLNSMLANLEKIMMCKIKIHSRKYPSKAGMEIFLKAFCNFERGRERKGRIRGGRGIYHISDQPATTSRHSPWHTHMEDILVCMD